MGRYSAGMTATIAGVSGTTTTSRPIFGILSTASVSPVLREVALWNTTAVACTYRLVIVTGGTPGANQTNRRHRQLSPDALCLSKAGWTADTTAINEDTGYRMVLGAAVGSAAILTFGNEGLSGTIGATVAIGLIPVATGQICEVMMCWDE